MIQSWNEHVAKEKKRRAIFKRLRDILMQKFGRLHTKSRVLATAKRATVSGLVNVGEVAETAVRACRDLCERWQSGLFRSPRVEIVRIDQVLTLFDWLREECLPDLGLSADEYGAGVGLEMAQLERRVFLWAEIRLLEFRVFYERPSHGQGKKLDSYQAFLNTVEYKRVCERVQRATAAPSFPND